MTKIQPLAAPRLEQGFVLIATASRPVLGPTQPLFQWVKVKIEVKSSCVLTRHHAQKAYWASGGIAPRILDLGTRWR
jgi:hypothetical protein